MQTKQCKTCDSIFEKKPTTSKKNWVTTLYCSKKCWYSALAVNMTGNRLSVNVKSQLGRIWTEEEKKTHSVALTGRKFSEEAKRNISLGHKGEKAYNWKGGISPIKELIRSSSKYKDWRRSILCRDRFACQMCGHKSSHLQVDHIKPFSVIINELIEIFGIEKIQEYADKSVQLWDKSNGRTLCLDCHKETPLYMNIKSTYKSPLSTLLMKVA